MQVLRLIICFFIFSALTGASCLPDHKRAQGQKAAKVFFKKNQAHIPPPGFKDTASTDADQRYCGGFRQSPSSACDEPREYCHREQKDICGAADAPGVCTVRPEACIQQYDPVCGCDGKTYSNACDANSNGVSVSAKGECTL